MDPLETCTVGGLRGFATPTDCQTVDRWLSNPAASYGCYAIVRVDRYLSRYGELVIAAPGVGDPASDAVLVQLGLGCMKIKAVVTPDQIQPLEGPEHVAAWWPAASQIVEYCPDRSVVWDPHDSTMRFAPVPGETLVAAPSGAVRMPHDGHPAAMLRYWSPVELNAADAYGYPYHRYRVWGRPNASATMVSWRLSRLAAPQAAPRGNVTLGTELLAEWYDDPAFHVQLARAISPNPVLRTHDNLLVSLRHSERLLDATVGVARSSGIGSPLILPFGVNRPAMPLQILLQVCQLADPSISDRPVRWLTPDGRDVYRIHCDGLLPLDGTRAVSRQRSPDGALLSTVDQIAHDQQLLRPGTGQVFVRCMTSPGSWLVTLPRPTSHRASWVEPIVRYFRSGGAEVDPDLTVYLPAAAPGPSDAPVWPPAVRSERRRRVVLKPPGSN